MIIKTESTEPSNSIIPYIINVISDTIQLITQKVPENNGLGSVFFPHERKASDLSDHNLVKQVCNV